MYDKTFIVDELGNTHSLLIVVLAFKLSRNMIFSNKALQLHKICFIHCAQSSTSIAMHGLSNHVIITE